MAREAAKDNTSASEASEEHTEEEENEGRVYNAVGDQPHDALQALPEGQHHRLLPDASVYSAAISASEEDPELQDTRGSAVVAGEATPEAARDERFCSCCRRSNTEAPCQT